jgi:His-Xaa-Ser system radical SAM maturase HxsC
MIPLALSAAAEAAEPYVVRLRTGVGGAVGDWVSSDARLLVENEGAAVFAGDAGLLEVFGVPAQDMNGDVVLVEPSGRRVERLLRAGSSHNTLLVTERCDQLCQMCSQPPKKTHNDRFKVLTEAALLAEPGAVVGITGGEPTLYKAELLAMMETVLTQRPDLQFHVLTNGQHFEDEDVERLRQPLYRRVQWGIPLYAASPDLHDMIVGKVGAFSRLKDSFARLILAGANVELRTVLLSSNLEELPAIARFVCSRLRFVDAWSIMQLENIGYARARWAHLYVDHSLAFAPIAQAIDMATLHGVSARLFNFPRCTVPAPYRELAAASISDWKRRYAAACTDCSEQQECSGFFEWHPDPDSAGVTPL